MNPDISTLSMREQQGLQLFIDKREVYRTTGHQVAARMMGVCIFIAWRVLRWEHTKEPRP